MADFLPEGSTSSRARANTMMRQRLKANWDKRCKYGVEDVDALPKSFSMNGALFSSKESSSEDNWCRLIDEGVVVDNDFWTGEPCVYAVIRKGVLKKWYDSLSDNFVGNIDKDHNRSIDLGTFTKKDLRLVALENGRYVIDANVKLDDGLYAVKDLKRMNNRTALSVEMFVNAEEFATAEKVTGDKNQGKYLVPLIDELKIEGYAVCLAPKSANSYKDGLLKKAGAINTNLTEDFNTMDDDEKKIEAVETEEETKVEDAEIDAAMAGEPVNSTEDTEVTEDVEETETTEETDATEEETTEETTEEAADESGTKEGEETTLSAIKEQIEQMKADLKAKDEKIAELEAEIAKKAKKEETFETELTNILSMATSSEPADNESVDATTSDDEKTKSEEVDAYAAAFADLDKEN